MDDNHFHLITLMRTYNILNGLEKLSQITHFPYDLLCNPRFRITGRKINIIKHVETERKKGEERHKYYREPSYEKFHWKTRPYVKLIKTQRRRVGELRKLRDRERASKKKRRNEARESKKNKEKTHINQPK